jgi:acetyltransferase
MIVSNGGGPGVMATDALLARRGRLADLPPALRSRLDGILPPSWSGANPIDLVGDATGQRYADTLRALRDAPAAAGLLVLHAPTALASGPEAAQAVTEALAEGAPRGVVLTSWLGGAGAEAARRILRGAGLPSYDTPEDAVRAFLHMADYRENQDQLIETPPRAAGGPAPDPERARAIVRDALEADREWLSQPEAMAILASYGIPIVESRAAKHASHAVRAAQKLGFPVALKILSPDIVHKSEVGGVVLDLGDGEEVSAAAAAMVRRVRCERPEARIEGFVVQRMERRPSAVELIAGATTDPIFGPVLLFGHGGTAVEVLGDRALALPPLNANLARELVGRTRVARLLEGYRDHPAVDRTALGEALVRMSQLVIDLPEIRELDANPLLADERGVIVLDARIRVGPAAERTPLAIRPYPGDLEEELELADHRRVVARPIRPEDEPAHHAFFERLDKQDVYFRFFNMVRELPHSQLARYTQIDYDREMAFIAFRPEAPDETLGVVRAVTDPDNERAEFAVIVRSDFKGRGLGRALLGKLIAYCRSRGTECMVGQVLETNHSMLGLARELGFATERASDGVIDVVLSLQQRGGRARG